MAFKVDGNTEHTRSSSNRVPPDPWNVFMCSMFHLCHTHHRPNVNVAAYTKTPKVH